MKSHIVSLCSYDDRFLVIDESGTFRVLFLPFLDISIIDVIEGFNMWTVIIITVHARLHTFLVKIVIVLNLKILIVFFIMKKHIVLL